MVVLLGKQVVKLVANWHGYLARFAGDTHWHRMTEFAVIIVRNAAYL